MVHWNSQKNEYWYWTLEQCIARVCLHNRLQLRESPHLDRVTASEIVLLDKQEEWIMKFGSSKLYTAALLRWTVQKGRGSD